MIKVSQLPDAEPYIAPELTGRLWLINNGAPSGLTSPHGPALGPPDGNISKTIMTTKRKRPDNKFKKFTYSQLSAESSLTIKQTHYGVFKGIKK